MTDPELVLRPFRISDYDAALALWQACEGIGLSAADERRAIAGYLRRNPRLSFVAYRGERLVGAVLCGHDGRRGFIHHLAVAADCRRQGLGQALVAHCLAALQARGIDKCHLSVMAANAEALAFWRRIGWEQRFDLVILSHFTGKLP